ncbi:MAG: tRNA (adenosine(37)-N6)-dimethylallyltransferase MiaA [candidate division Zixibacteria bacterium]
MNESRDKINILIIGGPTASRKSTLAINIAKEYKAEIISADSRQIYRQLKIGTDKMDEDEWQGIPHHLMGSHDLGDKFTAFDFLIESEKIITNLSASNKGVIVCGGTGLYLRALTEGIVELPDHDTSYRNELLDVAAAKGPKFIHEMLEKVDPEEAAKIHYNNMIRVIRALEIYNLTGRPKSEVINDTIPLNERFNFLQIYLIPERDKLYERINDRVDEMFKQGLLREAESVYKSHFGDKLKLCKIVGYAELIAYFENQLSLNEAQNLIKQNTRRYAKRQYTWFNNAAKAEFIPLFGSEALTSCLELIEGFWRKS